MNGARRGKKAEVRAALQSVLDVEGVVAVGKWSHREGDPLRLVHYEMTLGAAERDISWWLMNFCEWNGLVSQAQALEYENRGGTRGQLFPARFTMVEGNRYAFIGTRNQVAALVESARHPDVWRVVELCEKVP